MHVKAKAAETWGLLLFCCHALEKFAGAVGPLGARLLSAVRGMIVIVNTFKSSSITLTPAQLQVSTKNVAPIFFDFCRQKSVNFNIF